MNAIFVFNILLCLIDDLEIKKVILEKARSSSYSMHPGSTKMYHTFKEHYWWQGIKKEITDYVSRYLIIQQVKTRYQRPFKLL